MPVRSRIRLMSVRNHEGTPARLRTSSLMVVSHIFSIFSSQSLMSMMDWSGVFIMFAQKGVFEIRMAERSP